jgi:hypothetical protein
MSDLTQVFFFKATDKKNTLERSLEYLIQSSKLGGSPKPVACKTVHGRIKWVVPQVRQACEKKVI